MVLKDYYWLKITHVSYSSFPEVYSSFARAIRGAFTAVDVGWYGGEFRYLPVAAYTLRFADASICEHQHERSEHSNEKLQVARKALTHRSVRKQHPGMMEARFLIANTNFHP